MPRQLKGLLAELGIPTETANARGWGTLDNGELLEAAAVSGFNCLLTRDRLFGESVARSLTAPGKYPDSKGNRLYSNRRDASIQIESSAGVDK